MKPGDIVTNNTKGSYSKLFSSPLGKMDYQEQRKHTGNLTGIGVILDLHGSDVKVISGENIGWCYVGNVKVVE
jgi:hypothetical protein